LREGDDTLRMRPNCLAELLVRRGCRTGPRHPNRRSRGTRDADRRLVGRREMTVAECAQPSFTSRSLSSVRTADAAQWIDNVSRRQTPLVVTADTVTNCMPMPTEDASALGATSPA
jgi:hypothetical protein